MDTLPNQLNIDRRKGFTLLELMVAMLILTIAISISFQAFSGTMRAWKRGTEVIDGMKHGDFAMSYVASSLNSMLYFDNNQKAYAFEIEKQNKSGLPADEISFVTVSSAFLPPSSPFFHGPHRLTLYIDNDDYGNSALFAKAMPAVGHPEEEEDEYDAEPILASRAVQGLEVLFWDEEAEDWTEEWEKENAVPERISVTVFVVSEDENEEPIEFKRVIDIPVAEAVKAKLTSPTIKAKK